MVYSLKCLRILEILVGVVIVVIKNPKGLNNRQRLETILDRDRLYPISPSDAGVRALAYRHYSIKRPGGDSWWSPAKTLCLTNIDRTILFVWQRPLPEFRRDNQYGYCCTLFRNEDSRLSSDIILEAERIVTECWGASRIFTYVDSDKVKSSNPGYCYLKAGWERIGRSKSGKILLEKFLKC